jgi:hypothetical protein
MIKIQITGLALVLAFFNTALIAEPCKNCGVVPVRDTRARDRIREERAIDAKRIAEEPVTRPWDGMKFGPRSAEPAKIK